MERVKRIELLHPAWKASVLPLNYTRTTSRITLQVIKILLNGGGGKIRTFEDRSQRVYSPPHLTALEPLLFGEVPPCSIKLQQHAFYIFLLCNCNTRFAKKVVKIPIKSS